MTATAPAPARASAERRPALPGAFRTRVQVELKEFFRQRESVVFTLAFPVLLLLALGAGLTYQIGAGVSFPQYFMAGVISAGIVGASLQNLAIHIAGERSDGTLKSLAGTPMPKSAYFAGKVVQVLVVAVATIALLLLVGLAVFHIHLPTGEEWVTFAWVSVLGAAACTLLGITVSTLCRNSRSASATVTPIALALEFVSGVFMPFDRFPQWLQDIASVFPVRWMAQGLRSVFLPDALAAREPAHGWELGRVAAVLAAWCVVGLLLCVRTFRWQDRGDR
jgi:ABC-2 type transport system permease protein